MKVGDHLWHFDRDRRIYRRDENNRPFGGPIYREHFVQYTITGETKLSWLVEATHRVLFKINKKTLLASNGAYTAHSFFTDKGMEDNIWVGDNRYKISRLIERASADQLMECAKILGFKEDDK